MQNDTNNPNPLEVNDQSAEAEAEVSSQDYEGDENGSQAEEEAMSQPAGEPDPTFVGIQVQTMRTGLRVILQRNLPDLEIEFFKCNVSNAVQGIDLALGVHRIATEQGVSYEEAARQKVTLPHETLLERHGSLSILSFVFADHWESAAEGGLEVENTHQPTVNDIEVKNSDSPPACNTVAGIDRENVFNGSATALSIVRAALEKIGCTDFRETPYMVVDDEVLRLRFNFSGFEMTAETRDGLIHLVGLESGTPLCMSSLRFIEEGLKVLVPEEGSPA